MIDFAVERFIVKLSPAPALLRVLFVSLLSAPLFAQFVAPGVQQMNGMQGDQRVSVYETAPNTSVVIVHTFAEEKPVSLDRTARVDLTNLANHVGGF